MNIDSGRRRRVAHWVIPIVLGVALASGSVEASGRDAAPTAERWGVTVWPSGAEFELEFAVTDRARALGYMFREEVGPREGMLFVFDAPGRHGIWMKNCKVPLDIIWLDDRFRVLDIAAELQPCPADGACPSSEPMRAASYVLEVAGGVAEAEGLRPGDAIVVIAEPPLP